MFFGAPQVADHLRRASAGEVGRTNKLGLFVGRKSGGWRATMGR